MKMHSVEDLLKEYEGEVDVAVWSFYTWKHIGKLAVRDRDIWEALNANASTWNIIKYSLVTTIFTTIGRIFDQDGRSLTARSFVEQCKNNADQFSKTALETRKRRNGLQPDDLDNYLKDVYEPTQSDFEALIKDIDKYEKIYRDKYQPVRHKIMAHKDIATIGSKDALLARTNIREVESLLKCLHGVGKVVDQWYFNGQRTCLVDHTLTEGDFVQMDLENLLRKLVDRNGRPLRITGLEGSL